MSENKEKVIQFRCGVELFESFSELCSDNGSNISTELRSFMIGCVAAGEVVNTKDNNVVTGDFRDGLSNPHSNFPPMW